MPSHRGFKLASLNINKLTTHIDELRIFLAHNEIDILSINETKLNETISDNEVNILGYDIVRRKQNYRRWGRSMLLREKISKFYRTK